MRVPNPLPNARSSQVTCAKKNTRQLTSRAICFLEKKGEKKKGEKQHQKNEVPGSLKLRVWAAPAPLPRLLGAARDILLALGVCNAPTKNRKTRPSPLSPGASSAMSNPAQSSGRPFPKSSNKPGSCPIQRKAQGALSQNQAINPDHVQSSAKLRAPFPKIKQ